MVMPQCWLHGFNQNLLVRVCVCMCVFFFFRVSVPENEVIFLYIYMHIHIYIDLSFVHKHANTKHEVSKEYTRTRPSTSLLRVPGHNVTSNTPN
jgi:hypothetical protein